MTKLELVKGLLLAFACFFAHPFLGGMLWIPLGLITEEYFPGVPAARFIGFIIGFILWLPLPVFAIKKLKPFK